MKNRTEIPRANVGAAPVSAQGSALAESATQVDTTAATAQTRPRSKLVSPTPLTELRGRIRALQKATSATASQPTPAAASGGPFETLHGAAMSQVLQSCELRSAIIAHLGQSQSKAGIDILPRARELANIRASSTMLQADVASLMARPVAADIRRAFDQQSVQKSVAQLANTFVHDDAGFRVALQALLKDKQDVGIDLAAIAHDDWMGFNRANGKAGMLIEVLAEKADLKSLVVDYRHRHPIDVRDLLPALVAIHANNVALDSLALDYPASVEHNALGNRTAAIVPFLPDLARLTKLTRLNLALHGTGPALVPALAALTNLTSLDVASNRLNAASLAGLAAHTRLTSLNIAGNQMETAALCAALGTLGGALHELNSLNIGATGLQFRTDGTQLIAASSGFANLTSLGIALSMLRPADVQALAATHPGLTSLDIGWCDLPPGCLAALAALPHLGNLDVSGNDLSAAQVAELAALPNLTSLIVRRSRIDDVVAAALTELPDLTALDMRDSRGQLSQTARDALRAMPNMRQLKM